MAICSRAPLLSSGGSLLSYGPFSQSLFIESGEALTIEVEEISISIWPEVDFSTGRWSTYLQNAVLKHVLVSGQSLATPTIYVALAGRMPNFDDSGTDLYELSGGAYARALIDSWSSVFGRFSNLSSTLYDEATTDWSPAASYYVLTDALTGGNVLCWDDLTPHFDILTGDVARWLPDKITGQLISR